MRTSINLGSKFNTIIAVLLFTLLASSQVQAHLVLTDPAARDPDYGLRQYPCGGVPAVAPVATYIAGSQIEVTVELVVRHVNSLQVMISYDNFVTRTLLATISTPERGTYKMNVSLPQRLGTATLQATDGEYVSCADITLSDAASFTINAGLNDAWYFPDTNGQGFFIIVFPEIQQVFLAWFTFDTERPPGDVQAILGGPGQRWITAQGPFVGDTALLDIVVTQGGVFDMGEPKPSNSGAGTVGTIEVVFESCSSGVVRYNIPALGLMGEVPIQRVTNDNVALCEALE